MWAFKGSLEIPLAHVKGAYRGLGAEAEHGVDWTTIRVLGTFLPGVITAGTYYQHGKTLFWDVHNRERTVAIELHDERYNELVVEVADPDSTIKLITGAIAG